MNDRLREAYNYLRDNRIVFNQADFAKQIGKSTGQLAQMMNGKQGVSRSTVDTVCDLYPISKIWLLTGEGDMIVREKPAVAISNVGNITLTDSQNVGTSDASAELAALRAENKALREQVEWLRSLISK